MSSELVTTEKPLYDVDKHISVWYIYINVIHIYPWDILFRHVQIHISRRPQNLAPLGSPSMIAAKYIYIHMYMYQNIDMYTCINVFMCIYMHIYTYTSRIRSPSSMITEKRKCLMFTGFYPHKSPMISISFVQRDLQLRHPVHI